MRNDTPEWLAWDEICEAILEYAEPIGGWQTVKVVNRWSVFRCWFCL